MPKDCYEPLKRYQYKNLGRDQYFWCSHSMNKTLKSEGADFWISFFKTRETADLQHAVFLQPLRVEGQIIPFWKHHE